MMRRTGSPSSFPCFFALLGSLALASASSAQIKVVSEQKISQTAGGFGGALDNLDLFGRSVAAIGDLDGDGIGELAVGAHGDDDGGPEQGALWILFLNADGTVVYEQKISEGAGGFGGNLRPDDRFGVSIAPLGDLDGNGVVDLAVGADGDDDGDLDQGALWILFLNAEGTVASQRKISETTGGFGGVLHPGDRLGGALAALGDLDGNGVCDLAVGAERDDDGGLDQGAVWILFLNADGTVAGQHKISETAGGFGGALVTQGLFGLSLAALGDLDGDGVADLAVGNDCDDDGGTDQGAVWVLFLNADGTVASEQKISATAGGFGGDLDTNDEFGSALASVGDLDADGIGDLAVGAYLDDDGGLNTGAAWILFLNADGTVASEQKISETVGGFGGNLDAADRFGLSITSLGDLDQNGIVDLAIGSYQDDDGGMNRGAVWVLFVSDAIAPVVTCPGDESAECTGPEGAVVSFSVSATDDRDPAPEVLCVPPSGSAFPLGTTTVSCTATDDWGNAGTCSFHVTVVDTTPPILACPGDATAEATGPAGAVVSFAPTASDLRDPSPSIVAVPATGSTFPLGSTTVYVSATDDRGNVSTCSFVVTVEDSTAPVLDCPAGITVVCADPTVVSFSPTAIDLCDLAPEVVANPPSGSTFPFGATTVTVTATDAAGNASTSTFDVTVVEGADTTPPVVTCPADVTVEWTNPFGESVTYSAAVTDCCDLEPELVYSPPSGSVFTLGTTTVTVTATDDAGNVATSSFDVTVADRTPPIVTCPGDIVLEGTNPNGEVVTFSASAEDARDPAPALVCSPASGSTFPIGTTTVAVTATDDEGNASTCSFDVTVADTTLPVVTCPEGVTLECTTPGGQVVTYSGSAVDACDPAPALVYSPPSGSALPVGTTTVTTTATDDAGNASTCTFDVTIVDTTAPTLTCPPTLVVDEKRMGPSGRRVTFAVTSSDAGDPAPSVVCVPPSGSTFARGTTTVTVTATDASGNQTSSTFSVVVVPAGPQRRNP